MADKIPETAQEATAMGYEVHAGGPDFDIFADIARPRAPALDCVVLPKGAKCAEGPCIDGWMTVYFCGNYGCTDHARVRCSP